VRAGLLIKAARLLGQITRDSMLEQSLFRPSHGEENFAKTKAAPESHPRTRPRGEAHDQDRFAIHDPAPSA
jgi:hypothetical protein